MSQRDYKTWAAVNMGLKKPFGENAEATNNSEYYARNAFVTTFQPGEDAVHKAYISIALPPADAGFGIPKIILSEKPLNEEELGAALDKAAEFNCRWLEAFAKSNPESCVPLKQSRGCSGPP